MYICICQGITDRQIRRAVDQGARTLQDVQQKLPVAACCGRCGPVAHELIRHHAAHGGGLPDASLCAEGVFAG